MKRRLTLVLAVLALGTIPAAPAAAGGGDHAGGGGGGGACAGFAAGDGVDLLDSCIAPTFVPAGEVRIRNAGEAPHNLTAVDGSFTTGDLASGEVATLELSPGVYRAYCTLHGGSDGTGMAGVLIVGDIGTPSGDAQAVAAIAGGGTETTADGEAAAWWIGIGATGAVGAGSLALLRRRFR